MGTKDSFFVFKKAGCEADHSIPVPKLRIFGSTFPMRWCLLTPGKCYWTLKTNRTEFMAEFEHNVHTPITSGAKMPLSLSFRKNRKLPFFP
jgi:hypothetical protein